MDIYRTYQNWYICQDKRRLCLKKDRTLWTKFDARPAALLKKAVGPSVGSDGSGGRIDSNRLWPILTPSGRPTGVQNASRFGRSRRLLTDATRRGASAEPAFYAEPNPAPIAKMKKPAPLGPALFIFGSGGALLEKLELYAEPFPLVA